MSGDVNRSGPSTGSGDWTLILAALPRWRLVVMADPLFADRCSTLDLERSGLARGGLKHTRKARDIV